MGDVTAIDVPAREVHAGHERSLRLLIVAAAPTISPPRGEPNARDSNLEDAIEIRCRVLSAFEAAERDPDPAGRDAWMTFVVIGAGPTGVELAGAVGELAAHTLRGNFRVIDSSKAKVLLLEGTDRVLPTFVPQLSAKAARALEHIGVTVQTGTIVTNVCAEAVTYKTGNKVETIATKTVLWAAGVLASPLARQLAEATGAQLDKSKRIIVEPDLSLPGHPEILVLGDMAHFPTSNGQSLPGVAPVAIQQGSHAARVIRSRLLGKTAEPFRYTDKGSLAVIGRSAAVADLGWFKISGMIACWPAFDPFALPGR